MHAIFGLGNPGSKYENNRHNVGFMFLDFISDNQGAKPDWQFDSTLKAEVLKFANLSTNHQLLTTSSLLIKPYTFMNRSGEAVQKAMQKYKLKLDDIIVVHDDLDIELGKFKISQGKGPKIHNGTSSIENTVGKDFVRIRIGVDNRQGEKISGEQYVLSDFTNEEKEILRSVFETIVEESAL